MKTETRIGATILPRRITPARPVINLQPGETIDAYSKGARRCRSRCRPATAQRRGHRGWYDRKWDMGMEDPDFRAYTDDAGADYIIPALPPGPPPGCASLPAHDLHGDNARTFTFGAPEVRSPRADSSDVVPDGAKQPGQFVGANPAATESVKSATAAQRRNLAAAGLRGAVPRRRGQLQTRARRSSCAAVRRSLFHINTAQSVDFDHRRRAPACGPRFAADQTDFSRSGEFARPWSREGPAWRLPRSP